MQPPEKDAGLCLLNFRKNVFVLLIKKEGKIIFRFILNCVFHESQMFIEPKREINFYSSTFSLTSTYK